MNPPNPPTRSSPPGRRPPSVRRTALALAAAAVVAAWLPFSVFFASTLHNQTIVRTVQAPAARGAARVVTTRTSTGLTTVSSAGTSPAAAQPSQFVATRSS